MLTPAFDLSSGWCMGAVGEGRVGVIERDDASSVPYLVRCGGSTSWYQAAHVQRAADGVESGGPAPPAPASAAGQPAPSTPGGCGASCTLRHSEHGNCLRCGRGWGPHSGHQCREGWRGSWLVPGTPAPAGCGGCRGGCTSCRPFDRGSRRSAHHQHVLLRSEPSQMRLHGTGCDVCHRGVREAHDALGATPLPRASASARLADGADRVPGVVYSCRQCNFDMCVACAIAEDQAPAAVAWLDGAASAASSLPRALRAPAVATPRHRHLLFRYAGGMRPASSSRHCDLCRANPAESFRRAVPGAPRDVVPSCMHSCEACDFDVSGSRRRSPSGRALSRRLTLSWRPFLTRSVLGGYALSPLHFSLSGVCAVR